MLIVQKGAAVAATPTEDRTADITIKGTIDAPAVVMAHGPTPASGYELTGTATVLPRSGCTAKHPCSLYLDGRLVGYTQGCSADERRLNPIGSTSDLLSDLWQDGGLVHTSMTTSNTGPFKGLIGAGGSLHLLEVDNSRVDWVRASVHEDGTISGKFGKSFGGQTCGFVYSITGGSISSTDGRKGRIHQMLGVDPTLAARKRVRLRLSSDGHGFGGSYTGECIGGDCLLNTEPVDIKSVSNGCGGDAPRPVQAFENFVANTHTYRDSKINPRATPYTVDFVSACDLHDAGYVGAVVLDPISGRWIDYRNWTRRRVDTKFLFDLQRLCRSQIPPSATTARDRCMTWGGLSIGAQQLHWFVAKFGHAFYDADLTRPGVQGVGERVNDPSYATD